MRWYNAMIRRANLVSICSDCRIAIMISRVVLKTMTCMDTPEIDNEPKHWRETFYECMHVADIIN